MEAKKLDTIWKLGSIIVLAIGFCMIIYGIKDMDKKNKDCASDTLKCFTEKLLRQTEHSKIECSCQLYNEGERRKSFNFNENGRSSYTKTPQYFIDPEVKK